ncbi:hypothetical protein GCM10010174_09780 [Kutzneria viridogrisea]|uniref:Endo-beta-N-acetylglucosaminidase D n=1 Tax=Kutzneria viridogrisea TaxID=47990 RepID=A0ABR6BWV2_9PSEU|nr:endo-beta-N-acetylglucosaminidase D [Kutzneria viridogrisea]
MGMLSRRGFLVLSGVSSAALAFGAPRAHADKVPEPPAGAHEPFVHGYSASDLLTWRPETDPFAAHFRSRVPLATRIPAFAATQANPALSAAPKLSVVSSDYGYGEDLFPRRHYDVFSANTDRFWQYLDVYSSWHGARTAGPSHDWGVVNLPNPAWTDCAHRNGVLSLGCWFWPRDNNEFDDLVRRAGDGSYPVADKLIAMAGYFGFDGYFINQEASISPAQATALMAMLTYLRHKAPTIYLQWYDADLPDGTLDYQNRVNAANAPWLKACDSIFVNYAWSRSGVTDSAAYARKIGLDPYRSVFLPTDIEDYGFGQPQPPTDPRWVFPEGGTAPASYGMFQHSQFWNHGNYGNAVTPEQQQPYFRTERHLWSGPNENPSRTGRLHAQKAGSFTDFQAWDGIAHYVVEKSVIGSLPFTTRFNTGKGTGFWLAGKQSSTSPWASASAQDILPTWQWWTTGSASADYDHSLAYDGGTSLRLSGNGEVRLYKTKLLLDRRTRLSVTSLGAGLEVGLAFADGATEWVPVPAHPGAWATSVLPLATSSGRTIAAISLRVNGVVHVGELALNSGVAANPLQPRNFRIDKAYFSGDTAELLLAWDFEPVWYYDLRSEGRWLGRVLNDVHYVKSLQRTGPSTPVDLVPVAFDGTEGPAARVGLNWPG